MVDQMPESISEIDWTKLHKLLPTIEMIHNQKQQSSEVKAELANLIYQAEFTLASLKESYKLPNLNNSIKSKSVEKSLLDIDKASSNGDDLFEKSIVIEKTKYFTSIDYQYWLLLFLLRKHNSIRQRKLSLFQIIDMFVENYADKNFHYKDIEYTASGATRCFTNLRFAFKELKEVGLVNLYDADHKKSWSLTYFGFFIAIALVVEPPESIKKYYIDVINHFDQNTWFPSINRNIISKLYSLAEKEYFEKILSQINQYSSDDSIKQNGYVIFQNYSDFLKELSRDISPKKIVAHKLKSFLKNMEENYKYDDYMNALSKEFDSEKWFIKSINRS